MKKPGQFSNRDGFHGSSFQKEDAVNVSGCDGFFAADIPEPECKTNGDQGDRKFAGERRTERRVVASGNDRVYAYTDNSEINLNSVKIKRSDTH